MPVESVIVPLIVIVSPTTTVGFVGVVSIYVAGPLNVIVNVSLVLVVVVQAALTMAGVALPSSHVFPVTGRIVFILVAFFFGELF